MIVKMNDVGPTVNVYELIRTLQDFIKEHDDYPIEDYGVYFSEAIEYGVRAITHVTIDHDTQQCILARRV